jgi:hypothetical protein
MLQYGSGCMVPVWSIGRQTRLLPERLVAQHRRVLLRQIATTTFYHYQVHQLSHQKAIREERDINETENCVAVAKCCQDPKSHPQASPPQLRTLYHDTLSVPVQQIRKTLPVKQNKRPSAQAASSRIKQRSTSPSSFSH